VPRPLLPIAHFQAPAGVAPGQYVNYYDGDNPLNIEPHPKRSQNYFLLIGDWGKNGGPGPCQTAVAELMKDYVRKQDAAGKELLFVGSVGDNFYWNGVCSEAWKPAWQMAYGTTDADSPLQYVPWLSVMGNHDYGDTDPFAFCPQVRPHTHINGQPYASKQFNADRNPMRPDSACNVLMERILRGQGLGPNASAAGLPTTSTTTDSSLVCTRHYWLPDYNYHYEIPGADLEVIAIDTNANTDPHTLGGDLTGSGHAFNLCGGQNVATDFLHQVADAGLRLLKERAQKGTAKTVVILQHYPGQCKRDIFEQALPAGRQVKVLCAYGHVHDQRCEVPGPDGICQDVLTGGGGGCCAPEIATAGFTAVHLDDAGGYTLDAESAEVRMPNGQCAWRRRLQAARAEP